MLNKAKGAILIIAAVFVAISAVQNPHFSFILAVVVMGGWGIYEFKASKKSDLNDPLNPEQIKKRRENLDQILGWAQTRDSITNLDVQKLLGVPEATATRYLEYLVSLGKIIRVGERGQPVYYQIVKQ